MAELFQDKADHYAKRLQEMIDEGRKKWTEADLIGVRQLLEERDRIRQAMRRVQRLRRNQKLLARYQSNGVSKAQGLDEQIGLVAQLEKDLDKYLLDEVGPEDVSDGNKATQGPSSPR